MLSMSCLPTRETTPVSKGSFMCMHDYQRIADDIRFQLDIGYLSPGERLPSIGALGRHYGVPSRSVKAALLVLLVEGHIEFRPDSGMFSAGG